MVKEVIRENSFETNSSSQHVICITTNDTHVTKEELTYDRSNYDPLNFESIYIGTDGDWSLYRVNGYGRHPFMMLTTFKDKFKYALCEYCGRFYGDEDEFDDNIKMLIDIAKEVVPGLKSVYMHKRYCDIYCDKNGNEIKHRDLKYAYYDEENDIAHYKYLDKETNEELPAILDEENVYEVPEIGSIDHQSAGLLRNFIDKKGITLKEFLTNKKYVIIIDGDEYEDFDKYLASGMINKSFIKEIFPSRD